MDFFRRRAWVLPAALLASVAGLAAAVSTGSWTLLEKGALIAAELFLR